MKKPKAETTISIRFSDTDAMGVVWHGNYLKYFEDARELFGLKYKITPLEIFKKGYLTPIVKSDIDYKAPLVYGEKARVVVKYIYTPAAKIIFDYEIYNLATEKLCAIGRTIQVFLEAEGRTLELNKPAFYSLWEEKAGIKPQNN